MGRLSRIAREKLMPWPIPYADEVGLTDQTYQAMTAHNLDEMKRALAHLQLMSQNVMVSTIQGDIYYVRNGPCADPRTGN